MRVDDDLAKRYRRMRFDGLRHRVEVLSVATAIRHNRPIPN